MARIDRHKEYYKDAYYHLFNRGSNKCDIFLDQEDYFFYLKKIKIYKEKYEIEFVNYSLSGNHYHYTVKQLSDISVSKFMHILHTSYVYYFNRKYARSGPLFQDRYKQRIISKMEYLTWLSAYINGNNEIHKNVKKSENWQYSSYLDYAGRRNGTLCNKDIILSQFKSRGDYIKYVNDVISKSQEKKYNQKYADYIFDEKS